MKSVPLVLLITSVLLIGRVPLSVCGAPSRNNHLDDVLLNRAGSDPMSFPVGGKLLQYLHPQKPGAAPRLSRFPPVENEDNRLEEHVEPSKRNEDPAISIDLTFHLLRNMIEMARIENQKEQAELNRKYLDEVGK